MARRTEMWEILGVFDVGDSQLAIPAVSEPPQGDLRRGAGALEVGEISQHMRGFVDVECPS